MLIALLLAQVVPSGAAFTCTPTAVWDGDGPIWCAEGPKIRLHGIAAREIRQSSAGPVDAGCKRGHPCPSRSGVHARDALVRLLGGARGTLRTGHVVVAAPAMSCRSYGNAKGGRTAAACAVRGVGDLSCVLVQRGVAARWSRYGGDRLCR